MARRFLGSIKIVCDAPRYNLVVGCTKLLHFVRCEDVAWQQAQANAPSCCGSTRPLQCFTFVFDSGNEEKIWLAQCPACLRMFWRSGQLTGTNTNQEGKQ